MRKTVLPAIRVAEDGLGPAMLALSPSMRAYVVARVYYGMGRSRAAQAAGYSTPTPEVAKVQGYRLEHDERVQAAIGEESRKLMRAEGPASIRTLIGIRDNNKNEAKDRLKAAVELLNRAGLAAVSEAHLTIDHNHHMTEAQQDARILSLAREAGLTDAEARKLLIDPSKVIDAEFEEVPPEPKTPEQETRADRYRRTGENERKQELARMSPQEREAAKAEMRDQQRAQAKSRYAEAQQRQGDIEDFLAADSGDGSDGIADLL